LHKKHLALVLLLRHSGVQTLCWFTRRDFGDEKSLRTFFMRRTDFFLTFPPNPLSLGFGGSPVCTCIKQVRFFLPAGERGIAKAGAAV